MLRDVLVLALLGAVAACASIPEPQLPPPAPAELAAEPLGKARCLEIALEHVPDAAAWRARIDKARAALAGAQRLPNPTLGLSFEDLGLGGAALPVQTTLLLGEALADVAARGRRTEAARHDLAAEEQLLLAERADLAAAVAQAYDALVAARARVAIDQELQTIAEAQQRAVARFVEVGEAPRIDLERAQAEGLDAGLQLAADESASRAREIELAFALGFERPLALQLAEGLAAASEDAPPALEDVLAQAAEQSPRLRAAGEAYRAQLERANLAASGLRFLPVVRAGPRSVGGETVAVVELEAELPLFDQGQSERASASAELLAAAVAVRKAAHELAREIALAYEEVQSAAARLAQQARPLATARTAIRTRTERQFQAGEASYVELVSSRRDEARARLVVLDAQLELSSARTQLARALGAPGS